MRATKPAIVAGLPPDRPDDGLRLLYKSLNFGDYELELRPTAKAIEAAGRANPDFEAPKSRILLAVYRASTRSLTTFPIVTNFGKYFLTAKYTDITTIIVEEVYPLGEVEDGQVIYFDELPAGLIREPLAGFGLNFDMRFIAAAVERQGGVTTLRLTNEKGMSRKGNTFSMSYSLFDKFRRAINRTHRQSLAIVNKAKAEYLDANLNLMLDPSFELPEADGTRRPVAEILAETLIGRRSPETETEARAAARIVKKSVRTLIDEQPAELLDLRREIELVSLEELIELFDKKLGQAGQKESHWQEFFKSNAFILQLAFNLPAISFGDQVAVGGNKFDGHGGKLADYAVRLGLFGNLALIEIKTPKTPLIGKSAYRSGVHGPSKELVGAVTQVLDQRHLLQNEINNKKVASRAYDIFAYAVHCIVIVGREPATEDEKKSLELYRNNLRDVVVITFDELLWKLKNLFEFLAKTPEHSKRN